MERSGAPVMESNCKQTLGKRRACIEIEREKRKDEKTKREKRKKREILVKKRFKKGSKKKKNNCFTKKNGVDDQNISLYRISIYKSVEQKRKGRRRNIYISSCTYQHML